VIVINAPILWKFCIDVMGMLHNYRNIIWEQKYHAPPTLPRARLHTFGLFSLLFPFPFLRFALKWGGGVHSVAFVVRVCNIYDHPFSCLGFAISNNYFELVKWSLLKIGNGWMESIRYVSQYLKAWEIKFIFWYHNIPIICVAYIQTSKFYWETCTSWR
jgi:hypothetical protein